MAKKALYSFLIVLIIGLSSLFLAFFWWNTNIAAPSADKADQSVLITKGSSADAIGRKLKESGVIKSELAFKIYLRINNLAGKLPVGEFEIPKNLSLAQVVSKILEGPTLSWVTIPEGLRREQVPARFTEALNLTPAEARNFVDAFLEVSAKSEGYLFPDTYLVPKDLSPNAAFSLLKNTFDKKYSAITPVTNTSLTPAEIVVLASLVERETKINLEERRVVAGILMNRLQIGMPLQVDASVQYVLANMRCKDINTCEDWWPTVLRGDYTLNSPYNTYRINGLPATPIANPGITALQASLNPAESDYLYYIHDRNGQIHYAETLDEHNANVSQYIN